VGLELYILEKVQSQFIRRLFHLDCKTPTYALRLETNSCKLELALAGHIINFAIRLLSMDDSRIAKMCFKTLTSYAGQESRYNWSLHLKALLEKTGFEHLWNRAAAPDFIFNKQLMLDNLKLKLKQADMDRAANSEHLNYIANLRDEELIASHLHMGFCKTRILAQLRLNQTQFFWKDATHELQHESKCSFCNMDEAEDLFHFLINYKVHRESQTRFLTPLQINTDMNRENLLQNIVNLSYTEVSKVILYIIVSLNRRKWMNDL
jgi:hypothetical protein